MSASTALLTLLVVSAGGAVTLAFYSLGPLLGRWDRRRPYASPGPAAAAKPIMQAITIESIPPRESARVVVAMGTPPTPASVVTLPTAHMILPQPALPLPPPPMRAQSMPPAPPSRSAKGSVPPPIPAAARAPSIPPKPVASEFDDGSTIEGPRYTVVKSTRSKRS